MAPSQDHYCRGKIEEMTLMRDADFSAQAVTCLVFVTQMAFLGEAGVVGSYECVCVD